MESGMMNKATFNNSWKYLLLLLLTCIPIFLFLNAFTIRLWDESRLAINACEMYHTGNLLIPTFNGAPDMWNTKPPLMIWLQVFSMKLFGINEMAVRLPSALAALFTCIIIMSFSVRYIKNFWFGFIWVLVLVTSSGYIEIHAVRTGDYDALLTFFLTLGSFSFFVFLENLKPKYLYLFFVSMAFAVLTKSAAALMILPGLFIYAIIKKKFLFFLKNKHFYIGLSVFLIGAGGYYFMREIYNPGYLQAVMENEFGSRFLDTIEGHKRSFWFYFENLFSYTFIIWVFFVPCGIIVGRKHKDKKIKDLTLFASIMALIYFLVISSAQTKLSWYVVPMYPFLALLVGIFIFFVFSRLKEKKLKHKVLPYIFLIAILIVPYSIIIVKIYQQQKLTYKTEVNGINYYLRDLLRGNVQNDNFTIVYDGVFTHGKFYLNLLLKQGKNIALKSPGDEIKTGEVILISQNEVRKFLEGKYELKILEELHITGMYQIVREKDINIKQTER